MSKILEIAPPQVTEPLIGAEQLAAHLHVSDRFIRKMVDARNIPFYKVYNGKRHFYRFRISEVEAALREGVHERVLPTGEHHANRTENRA